MTGVITKLQTCKITLQTSTVDIITMFAKTIALLLWLFALGGFVMTYSSPFDSIALGLTIFLVAAHSIECIVYAKRIAVAEGSNAAHFLQLFIFGYIHAKSLPEL